MAATPEGNFVGRMVKRLGAFSYLIDAATSETIAPSDLPLLISSFGAGFLAAGLKPGDRILVGCVLSPQCSLAYLGAIYAGLVATPVEDRVLAETGDVLLNKSGARAVWTEKNIRFNWVSKNTVLYLHGSLAAEKAVMMPPVPRTENDLAALVATSGSTGVPRFVMVTHGNLIANTEAIIRSQHIGNDERAMLVLPLSYCFGASVLHTHLYQSGGVVFDRRFMFPDKVLHAIAKHGCTTFAGVPTVYNILLKRSNIRAIPMPSLRRFLQAGGALATQNIQEMRSIVQTAKFYVMYGQTEATARISCLDPENLNEKLGSAGRPLDNLTVRVIDDEGQVLPSGVNGEIWVRGPSISPGYLNDPEENRRVFVDGWLRTRDLAHLDKDGYLWIHGRKDAFLKMRGVRVSINEVETKVSSIPGVCECAATSVPHPEAGEALDIFIVPEKGAQHLAEQVRRSLPPHWTCESIHIVSELPKTSSGKISHSSLPTK